MSTAELKTGAQRNLLLEKVEYKVDVTPLGVWKRFMYPNGGLYEEFVADGQLMGVPLIHYTRGICPETGRRKTAKGFIAVGRVAVGFLAIGQAAFGVVAIGQLALGLIFGLGQACTGMMAIGQLAVGGLMGVGQFACGYAAIGQMAAGYHVLAQVGVGIHSWTMQGADPAAVNFFRSLLP